MNPSLCNLGTSTANSILSDNSFTCSNTSANSSSHVSRCFARTSKRLETWESLLLE